MRRSLGGLLLLVSGALFAVAIGTFGLERVAFTPANDTDATHAIMGDEDIRRQVASLVASNDAAELGQSSSALRDSIEGYLEIREMSMEIRQFTFDAHRRVIGDNSQNVVITPEQQVELVRSERVALRPPITLPVNRVGAMAIIASVTTWTWMISFALASLALLVGLVMRPERGEYSFAFAVGTASTGVLLVTFGYLVPAFLLPAVSDDIWVAAIGRLAGYRRTATLIGGAVFVLVGALTMLSTSSARRRRQRSTPLSVGRFREQQRWSN